MKTKRTLIFTATVLALITAALTFVLGANSIIRASAKPLVLSPDEVGTGYDCILVLGAGVKDGTPSSMLSDRLTYALALYESDVAPKLLMSGDHGREDYDEVNVMKSFAIQNGVPSEDIFMDHAGFSTYESIYRAKEIFGVERMVIVTQEYHLYRALYIADELGIEAVGVGSDPREYTKQFYRGCRELLARSKDLIQCTFRPLPTYLGEKIPISGNGDVTNDK